MKTAGLFVDITNHYYSTTTQNSGLRIDYAKYIDAIRQKYSIYRAFAFGSQLSDEANSFINVLKTLGFESRYRKAISYGDKPDIRRTDRNMMLAMEVWRHIDKLDAVIIGSNDPDLAPLVLRIKELGVQVIVYSANISQELKASADITIEVDSSILYRKHTQTEWWEDDSSNTTQ